MNRSLSMIPNHGLSMHCPYKCIKLS